MAQFFDVANGYSGRALYVNETGTDTWTLVPKSGEVLAESQTKRSSVEYIP